MRMWRLIPPDPLEGGELPATEFVHPLPLLALALLAINDHWLKGGDYLPSVITGKLSDFTGIFFFPLLLTACFDVALYGLQILWRRPLLDASLRRWKLLSACIFTAALMIAIKLSPAAASLLLQILDRFNVAGLLGPGQIIQDPTDLWALPMLVLAYYFGRKRIAEIPPGRFAWIHEGIRRGHDHRQVLRDELSDCATIAKKSPALFLALQHGLDSFFKSPDSLSPSNSARLRAKRALHGWRS